MSVTEKTYTTKQVFTALLPWTIITVMVVLTTGLIVGWFSRSDYESTIRKEVDAIAQRYVKEK